MAEILLVRHAKAYANERNFTAFGNEDSPLTEAGIVDAKALNAEFHETYGIIPERYGPPVMASEFVRPQMTARYAGFPNIEPNPLINESAIDREGIGPKEAIIKHARERWVPQETAERAARLIEMIRTKELSHRIFFTHGLFIAATILHLANEAEALDKVFLHEFTEQRGYIPRLATIIPVTV